MSASNRNTLQTIKHVLGWILRPRLAYRRIREMRWIRTAPPLRDDLPLDHLPKLELVLAETEEQLRAVLGIYKRCPSSLVIAPRSWAKLQEHLADNKEFYLARNEQGDYIAAIGWLLDKDMAAYLASDYKYRRGGIGLATKIALLDIKRKQGVKRAYGQILRKNTRYLSTNLTLGYKIDEAQSTEDYYVIYKDLNPDGESDVPDTGPRQGG